MSPLLRRRKPDSADPTDELVQSRVDSAPGRPAPKGKPTPRRKEKDVGRIGPPAPPPKTRKEAYARARAQSKEQRGTARAGAAAGEDRFVMARDRGPVRRLVRDVVDSRRGIGSWFLVVGVLIIAGNGSAQPQIRLAATVAWVLLLVGLVVDWTLMGRKVARLVHERHPDDDTTMRKHLGYAVLRSTQFRKLRQPAPRVRPGQQI